MQIGEVIRKHRKNKNLTQEEMANRLGVTAPAVNKWENGNSLPDIMLLAPIARLLGVSIDTLLTFHEELDIEEVYSLIREADTIFKDKEYEEGFQWVKKKLELYPNCENLHLRMAQILDAQRLVKNISNLESYSDFILSCYIRVLSSKEEDIRYSAADSLFGFYLRQENYEKAEEYLAYFSKQNPERKRKQAEIYSKTNRVIDAYRSYEEMLFSGYQIINMVLTNIYMLAMQENDTKKAHFIVDKQMRLANVFDMGKYHECSPKLDLAIVEKDIETIIETVDCMLKNVDGMCDFSESPLYEHMTFKKIDEEFFTGLKSNLLENFRDEETFGFLKDNDRWKEIVG